MTGQNDLIGCADFLDRRGSARGDMLHSENRALVDYWHLLRAGRACPFRAEIDPRDIPAPIGNIFLLEDRGRGDIRFRLAGSSLMAAFGMELRQMPFTAIMTLEERQNLTEMTRETLEERGIGSVLLARAGRPGELWEMPLLPLRSENGAVDRVLGALRPLTELQGTGELPLTFGIQSMTITSVAAPREPAEVPEPDPRLDRAPFLRPIPGGSSAGPTPMGRAGRPMLRVIQGS